MRKLLIAGALPLFALGLVLVPVGAATSPPLAVRSLDGSGNNRFRPDWGKAGTQYLRVAATNYADGIAKPATGPLTRYVSNRVFNDVGQNLFSENGVTQWGWAWGQFMDHDFGLRDETAAEIDTDRVRRDRSARGVHERLRGDGLCPHPGRAGNGCQLATAADQHDLKLHRLVECLRRHELAARVAAQRACRRQSREQRGEPDVDEHRLSTTGRRPS